MADNTIDTLELEIKSSSTSAVHALDKLADTLYSLNKAFKSVNSGGMRNYSREIGRVSASIKALAGIKVNTEKISGVGEEFKKLSKKLSDIDTEKIQSASEGIAKISKSMSLLNNVDFKDSKITNVLGALKRLAEVDMGKFDSDGIASIVSSISNLSDIPDVSSGLNRFMSSLQKLVNAGDKTGQVVKQLPSLGKVLKSVVNDMAGSKKVSESVNLFVQSIGRLASAGNKTGQTAGQLKRLADETLKFFDAMQNAPKISENTIRMTQALAQLASAGGKVGTATNTITKSFNKISNIGNKTLSSIKKISIGIISSFQKIGSSSHHLKTASFNLGSLLKTAIGFRAIRGLWNFGKQSIKFGSDIAEVQNVVDVAFGNMSGMVDEFAKTSDEKFGLSELAAKQYSGTMMAMLKSSGIARNTAAEMSTTLAGLAGDIASFYNIDTDEAFRKIRSGIAGEIEPLRQLGISMTVANLEAFALSQGITKSYQAMTQAEQAILRYNYLLWASADAQGDFARTSGNYANQIRMFKLNIQQLSATIGQGIIAAILPAIQGLNALISMLIKAANAFKVFMYTLMGKKVEGTKGIVQDISGIGDAGDVAAGGLGDAADSADKLKKKLSVLPFDQLNQLTDNSDKSGSGGSGGSGGGIGGGGFDTGLDDILSDDKEGPISEWAKRIREAFLAEDWEKLGFEIADGLNRGLQKVYDVINWKNVGPKITAFTTAFTETFNSFVKNFDWDLLGRVIGTGINTAVNTFNQFVGPHGIDFVTLGNKLSEGFRGIVNEIQWENLGHALGNGFMVSWNMTKGFIDNMWATSNLTGLNGWQELGISIANGTKALFERIDFASIGTTLANGFNGAFETLKAYVAQMTSNGTWSEIATNIYTGLNNMIQGIDWASAGKTISDFVVNLLGVFKKVAQETDWEGFGRGIGQFLSNIDWFTIFKSVFDVMSQSIGRLIIGFSDTVAGKLGVALVTAIAGVKIAGAALPLADSIYKEITGKSFVTKISGSFSKAFESSINLFKPGGLIYETLGGSALNLSLAFESLTGISVPIGVSMGAIVASIAGVVGAITDLWNTSESFRDTVTNTFEKVKNSLIEAFNKVKEAILPLWESIKNLGSTLYGFYESSGIKSIVSLFFTLATTIGGTLLSTSIDSLSTAFSGLASILTGAVDILSSVFEILNGLFTFDFEVVIQGFKDLGSGILESIGSLTELVYETGKDIINGLLKGITDAISDIGSWLKENVVDRFIENFKNLFGIHSPSTVMAELGGYLMEGLLSGISNLVVDVVDIFTNVKDSIGKKWNEIKRNTSEVWSYIKTSVLDIWEKMKTTASDKFSNIKDFVSKAWSNVTQKTSDIWSGVKNFTKTTWDNLKTSASEKFGNIKDSVSKAWSNVKGNTSSDWSNIKSNISSIWSGLNRDASTSFSNIDKTVSSSSSSSGKNMTREWQNIQKSMMSIIESIDSDFSKSIRNITRNFGSLPTDISKSIGSLYKAGKEAAQSFANGFRSVHIATPHIYTRSYTRHKVGDTTFSTPNFGVDWYKTGGLFSKASVIGVGEAGKEAVLPLENKRTMSMIADSIVKSSSGMGIDEETLANAVARGVSMAMLNGQNPVNVTCYAELRTEDNEVLARAVTKGQRSIDSRMNPTLQFGY